MISLAVQTTYVMHGRVKMSKVLVRKNLNRWFKEKWVDVSRKDPKTGKHPPCGRSKAKKDSKGYPKCRPSVKVSSKTPKTSGSMSEGEKSAATKRKRSKKQGVGGKPTIVKAYKRRRHSRRREPANIFGIKDHSKAKPVPKLIWGDPRGDEGHLDSRLNRSFRPEEIENVIGLGNSAWEKHGEKIWNTPKMRKKLMSGGQLAMITHSFDPPIMDISGHGTSAAPLMSHHILRLTGRMGDDGEPTLAVTTTHPATNMNAIKNKYDYIIDASDPEMPFDKGYGGFFENSEPMEIAFQLLKQAKSPEALANKRKYDTKYHSTPDRVKYRQELNQERRKRGVYGKGGKDMSHTKNGNLVAEDASKNRARHFKSRGTLKSVKILRSS